MWGEDPWENDPAADWFGSLMDVSELPFLVRKALLLEKEEDPTGENTAMLRAAAYCMIQFGRVHVWPIDALKSDLALAIKALEKVLKDKEYCYSDRVVSKIDMELGDLRHRLGELRINHNQGLGRKR